MADILNETLKNIAENATQNATEKPKATPEGMAVAYSSLLLMSLIPIYFGSYRSLKYIKEQKEKGEKLDTISQKDAMLFPIIASFTLLSLYIIYKLVPKEYITMMLMSYFFILGVLALAHIVSPYLLKILPESDRFPNLPYHLLLTRGTDEKHEELIKANFCTYDILSVGLCGLVGLLHLWQKHWITNNIFGLAFCLNGIEIIHIASFKTGALLLGGLFFYDIFWVFKTDVMVTVAKNVEAPIKLMFPQDLLENGLASNNCAMLGLGDIVIPGIFIALLLRYDRSMKRGKDLYFHATFLAYIAGLVVTIFIMHVFKHAQPALLYLVPACLGAPLLASLVFGELNSLINYNEDASAGEETAEQPKKDN